MPTKYLTTMEAAKRLCTSRWSIYKHIKSGKLKASRPGKRELRISESDLKSFMARRRV